MRFIEGLYASGDFFRTLGVVPALGRVFSTARRPPGLRLARRVLGYSSGSANMAARPSAIGRKILLKGKPFEIIGVAQAGFFGVEVGKSFDVVIPVCAEPLMNGANAHIHRSGIIGGSLSSDD